MKIICFQILESLFSEKQFPIIIMSLILRVAKINLVANIFSQSGTYQYSALVSGKLDYILVTITSKAANDQTLPFRTKCWASSDGFEEFDAQATKLAVFAQVEQGNRPVLHAKVE